MKKIARKQNTGRQPGLVMLILIPICLVVTVLMLLFTAAMSGQLTGVNSGGESSSDTAGTTANHEIDCSGASKVPSKYMPWVKDAAGKFMAGDEAALISIIQTESSWNPKAPNGKNIGSSAAGLGQFLVGTAKGFPEFVGGNDKHGKTWDGGTVFPGIPANNPADARFDPERSIYATAHYFGALIIKHGSPGDAYQKGYVGGGSGSAYANKARMNFDKIYDKVKQGCTNTGVGSALSYTAGKGCNNVPLFKQCQGSWASQSYGCGNTTVCSSGCGLSAAAMVLKYYGVNTDPGKMASYSLQHGYRACGAGTSYGFFPSIAKQNGLQGKTGLSWASVMNYLQQGKPVIVSGKGSAPFTSGGHFIVLTCYDAKTKMISVNDSAGGSKRDNKSYQESYIRDHHHSAEIIFK